MDFGNIGNDVMGAVHGVENFFGGGRPQPVRTTPPQPVQRAQIPTTHAPGQQPVNLTHVNPQASQPFHAYAPSATPAGYSPNDVMGSFIQGVTRTVPEIAATVSNRQINVPGSNTAAGKVLLGSPVKPIQQDVKGVYQANQGRGKVAATGLAAADALYHVLGDVGAVTGAGVAAKDIAKAAVNSGAKEALSTAGEHLTSSLSRALPSDQNGFARVPGSIGKTAAQGAQTVSKAQLSKSIVSHYKGGSAGPQEAQAFDWVKANPVEAMHGYDAQVAKEYGAPQSNIVSGDSAKFAIPGMSVDKSGIYHEPASALAKAKLDMLLKDPATKDKPVLLMAGGAGAGKTSALKSVLAKSGHSLNDFAAVVDTNSNKLDSAARNIDKAVASGRKVQVQFVYRDPYDAFVNGVMPRAQKIGRIVPNAAVADTHFGSRNVIQQLAKKYASNPNVEVRAIDNSGPRGTAKLVDVANLPKPGYNKSQLVNNINKAVHDAYQQGTISETEARTYLGRNSATAVPQEAKAELQAVRGSEGERHGSGNERTAAGVVADAHGPESVGSILERRGTSAGSAPPRAAGSQTAGGVPGAKERKFITSVKNSPEVSPEVQGKVAGTYKPLPNKTLVANSEALVSKGLDKATNEVLTALDKKTEEITPQDVSNAISVAHEHDSQGNYEQATNLYNKLAEHGTSLGQRVQAFALLARRTPEGILNMANKSLKEGGAKLTPELQQQVKQIYERIKATPPESKDRAYAVQDLQRLVDQNTKQKLKDQAFTLWRTGLLTGPQTATKVLLSHAVMNAAEKVKDVPASILDTALSAFTGMRSTALTLKGTGTGAKQGAHAALELLLHGHDEPGTSGFGGGISEQILKNGPGKGATTYGNGKLGSFIQKTTGRPAGKVGTGKILNFYTTKVGQVHAAMPKPFYRSAYVNDLYKQADAAAKTAKVPLGDRKAFVDNFVNNPDEQAAEQAHIAAQYATFQQPTFMGKVASSMQKTPGAKILAPFAHIASAILTDVKNYSPIGAMQSVFDAVKASKTGWTPAIQKQLVEGVGRGVTGTGVIALGGYLFDRALITNGYPTDKKEQALWKAEGKQENSIKINGQWRQTGSLGPLGSLLAAGALYQSSKGTNAKGKSNATAALEGALANISSQSYFSGTEQFAAAVQNPTEYGNSFAKLMAGSVVPTGVGTVARATDSKDRTANTPLQTLESKIPGVRESLPATSDMFGNIIPRQGGVATNLLDPTRPTMANNDAVTAELQRLVNKTGTSGTPVPAPPTKISGVTPDGKKVDLPLTKSDQQAYTKFAGPQIKQTLQGVINDPRYQSQSDDVKNKALSDAYTNANTILKSQWLAQQKPGAAIKLTAAQVATTNGNSPDFISNAQLKAAGVTSSLSLNKSLSPQYGSVLTKVGAMNSTNKATWMKDPKNKYNYDVASATNDYLNGKYDSVQWFTKQQDLAKQQVTSDFPTTITELYGKSKAEITKYLSGQTNAGTIENQLVSLDNALYNGGFITTPKFKNGVTSSGSSGSSGSTSKMAGGYPVIKAPTNDLSAYKALDAALKSTSTIKKPASIRAQKIVSYKATPMKVGKGGGSGRSKSNPFKQKSYSIHKPKSMGTPKLPKLLKPSSGSISTSTKSGQRVKLSV
jgi:hypothetical protein